MKALVTGGTGFIGRHLVERLVERGDRLTALVRDPRKAGWMAERGVRVVPGGLDDGAALAEATAGQEVVYHLAGTLGAHSERDYRHTNETGTANLAAAARRHGEPRLVLVSSLAAAGPTRPGRPLEGGEPPAPVSAYGRSKLGGEEAVRASGVPWTIVRPPLVYGPWDREVLKVFRGARLPWVPVSGDGSQELSAVYAPDLAAALLAVAASPATVGRVYYPCHGERFTSAGLVHAVARALGRRVRTVAIGERPTRVLLAVTGAAARLLGRRTILTPDKANELFQPAWTCDPAALTRDTGWRAEHDLASGLPATVAWYRRQGWI